jgi:hypothetical protein
MKIINRYNFNTNRFPPRYIISKARPWQKDRSNEQHADQNASQTIHQARQPIAQTMLPDQQFMTLSSHLLPLMTQTSTDPLLHNESRYVATTCRCGRLL